MTQSNLTFKENYEIPQGLKKTELGFIPEDWQIYKLSEIIKSIQLGGNYPNSLNEKGFPLIKMGNLNRGSINLDKIEFIQGEYNQRDKLNYGDLLFNTRNTPELVGKVAIWRNELPIAYFNSNIMRIKFRGELVSNNFYINYAMNTKKFIDTLSLIATGTTSVAAIYTRDLLNLSLVLPPCTEQEKIATALSDTDALISELEKLIEKKQAIKTATMQQLLTGKTRLPEFTLREDGTPKAYKNSELGQIPEDWIALSIGSDTSLKARIGWQALTTAEYLKEGNYLLVTGTDFNGGLVNWNSCCYVSEWRYKQDKNIQLQKHDVLVTKDGTIGKVGFIENLPLPATLNSGVFVVRPKLTKCLPRFLFYILTSSYFNDFVKLITAGSTIVHLYQKDFVNFKFYVPHNIEEQSAIANILADLDTELAKLNLKLDKLKNIKQGMMQELLTGKTRLV
nr:restriction endonuclease subunit S [Acinetobacter lwoffii]